MLENLLISINLLIFYYIVVTYKEYLENIKNFSYRTVDIYVAYAKDLEECGLDYKKLLLSHQCLSTNTKRLLISAIKCYYKYLEDTRVDELELPKKDIIVNDFVTHSDYKNYLEKINSKTKKGFQKRLILRLLFETGIRASELLYLKKSDIKENKILINGKGRRQRMVMVSNWLGEELNQYLKNVNEHLFEFGYKNLYNKIGMLDKTRKLTPHMFRRGYAKYCHDKGVSIYDISLSMGHSSIETTAAYISRSSEDVEIHKIF